MGHGPPGSPVEGSILTRSHSSDPRKGEHLLGPPAPARLTAWWGGGPQAWTMHGARSAHAHDTIRAGNILRLELVLTFPPLAWRSVSPLRYYGRDAQRSETVSQCRHAPPSARPCETATRSYKSNLRSIVLYQDAFIHDTTSHGSSTATKRRRLTRRGRMSWYLRSNRALT